MINQQLIDYIKQSRQAGIDDSTIRQALLGSGYSVQDIEEGLNQTVSGLGLGQLPPKPKFSFKFPKKLIKILAVLIIVLVAVIGGYFALANYFPQYAKYVQPYLGPVLDPFFNSIGLIKSVEQPQATLSPQNAINTSDWKTYKNIKHGFESKYPKEINEYDIGAKETEISNPPFQYDDFPNFYQNGYAMIGLFVYAQSSDPEFLMPDKLELLSKILINNKEWYFKTHTEDWGTQDTYQTKLPSGETFQINLFDLKRVENSIFNDKTIRLQVISTFKFTVTTDNPKSSQNDSDNDGLLDIDEVKYGTDPNKPDTDGDGYPDGEEVQNGYNPLGPGKILSTDSLIRNKKRIEDINNIRGAINLYFEDHKYFPPNIESATLKGNLIADIRTDPVTSKSYHYSYYPNDKSIGYHLWAELENNHTLALKADSDINSNQSGWAGDKIDASKTDAEICISSYDNGTARDCIYDVGEYDVYKYGFKNNFWKY